MKKKSIEKAKYKLIEIASTITVGLLGALIIFNFVLLAYVVEHLTGNSMAHSLNAVGHILGIIILLLLVAGVLHAVTLNKSNFQKRNEKVEIDYRKLKQ